MVVPQSPIDCTNSAAEARFELARTFGGGILDAAARSCVSAAQYLTDGYAIGLSMQAFPQNDSISIQLMHVLLNRASSEAASPAPAPAGPAPPASRNLRRSRGVYLASSTSLRAAVVSAAAAAAATEFSEFAVVSTGTPLGTPTAFHDLHPAHIDKLDRAIRKRRLCQLLTTPPLPDLLPADSSVSGLFIGTRGGAQASAAD
ncbi:hypothetical protein T492DRAFT_883564 [Pavlovales sp. CCMP2436]|nr:hypothetical protein T492DRAFT_883564 [Pavlovales sp. CCMP2436]